MSDTKIRRTATRAGAQLFLSLLFSIAPQIVFAYKAAFEGSLISNSPSDPPMAIVISFESNIAGVYGNIRMRVAGATEKPLTGVEVQGTCDLLSDLGGSRTLKMKGSCSSTARVFEGSYSITSVSNYKRQSGMFRLKKTNGDSNGSDPGQEDTVTHRFSGLTPARCTNANIACLIGCPRGEYNSELLCANRCRAKLNACRQSIGPPEGSTPSDKQ